MIIQHYQERNRKQLKKLLLKELKSHQRETNKELEN